MKDIQQDAPFAESAIGMMNSHGIPLTPENYMVWYTHVAGEDPTLSRLIDVYQSNGEPFSDKRNQELFDRFCAPQKQAEAIEEVGSQMGKTLTTLMGGVEENIQNTAAYGDILSNFSAEMAASPEAAKMAELITTLHSETSFMHNRIKALEDRLSAGATEISDLKKQLGEVQREANTDSLTMVANRKRFDMELRSQAADAIEAGTSLCLAMVDIDHFKAFNDTHGHQIGDLVLRLVARTLDLSTKGQDTVARYGGEEFAIILPETVLEDGFQLAERIRQKMAESRIRLKDREKNLGRVTISTGIAQYQPGEPLQQLIERADECLYKAKKNGRNCVIAANKVDAGSDATDSRSNKSTLVAAE